jgi:hypothetical protein
LFSSQREILVCILFVLVRDLRFSCVVSSCFLSGSHFGSEQFVFCLSDSWCGGVVSVSVSTVGCFCLPHVSMPSCRPDLALSFQSPGPCSTDLGPCRGMFPSRARGLTRSDPVAFSEQRRRFLIWAALPVGVRFGASVVESSRVSGGSLLRSFAAGFPRERERVYCSHPLPLVGPRPVRYHSVF